MSLINMHASKSWNRWGKWRDIRVKDWRRKCYRPQTNEDTQRENPYLCRRRQNTHTHTHTHTHTLRKKKKHPKPTWTSIISFFFFHPLSKNNSRCYKSISLAACVCSAGAKAQVTIMRLFCLNTGKKRETSIYFLFFNLQVVLIMWHDHA